ncbi:3-methyl-2-oxobutanoate hydroxymethyltransferase [Micrococcoides hystricis]|uniref:3-methyl-2-oxobutanoate hydroxymethyltransferase n=1 Tax=Micrococcoides hystricis TaxID=1572761 RepID=A0ABV6P6U7_9MICC
MAISADIKQIRTTHLAQAKQDGTHFAMLTAYDQYMAEIFDAAGIETLLVGDSAANNVLGHRTTLPITLDQMITFSAAVVRSTTRAMVIADMPFGSYEVSPEQAVASGIRLLKEAGVAAVKMEGGEFYAPHIEAMTAAGVPVMAHIGFTPQSENTLGGYRVQGRGDEAAADMVKTAQTLEAAGAFGLLMEMVPTSVANAVDEALTIPTVGIGAGPGTTGQVLVWQDMLGLRGGRMAKFVKQYANLRPIVEQAARDFHKEVVSGAFPDEATSFSS